MYSVLTKMLRDDITYFAVQGDAGVEVLSEADLKILLKLSFEMYDPEGNKLSYDEQSGFSYDIPVFSENANNEEVEYDVDDIDEDYWDTDEEEIVDEDSESEDVEEEIEEDDFNENDYWNTGEEEVVDEDSESEDIEEEIEEDDFDENDYWGTGEEVIDEDEDEEDEVIEDDFNEDDYWGEGSFDEESVVNKLYSVLTPEQVDVIKKYYLWFSQRIFENGNKTNGNLPGFKVAKNMTKKRNLLNQIKLNGDYRYAGFLDAGSKLAGYTCNLGHPLRYLHVAWDITKGDIDTVFFGDDCSVDIDKVLRTPGAIVFGIKCIGDFFEVDKDSMALLMKAQREALKDMELMYYQFKSGEVEAVKSSFNALDEIVKRVTLHDNKGRMASADFKPILSPIGSAFYMQFKNVGLPLPKTFVQEMRNCLVGWSDGKTFVRMKWAGHLKNPSSTLYDRVLPLFFKDEEFIRKVRNQMYGYSEFEKLVYKISAYINMLFEYQVCGYYAYDGVKNKDEGGASQRVLKDWRDLCNNSDFTYKFSDADWSVTFAKKLYEIYSIYKQLRNLVKSETCFYDLHYLMKRDTDEKERLPKFEDLETLSNFEDVVALLGIIFTRRKDYTYDYRYKNFKEFFSDSHWLNQFFSQIESGKLTTEEYIGYLNTLLSSITNDVPLLKEFLEAERQRRIAEEERKKEEARLEEERKQKEAEQRRLEEERKRQEMASNLSSIDTREKVLEYLKSQDLTSYKSGSKFSFAVKLVEQLGGSGKKPSDKQFSYIQGLYEKVTGVKYEGEGRNEKISLDERKDLEDAMNFLRAHREYVDETAQNTRSQDSEKLLGIMDSVMKWRTISPKQLAYLEAVLETYKKYGGISKRQGFVSEV